MGLNHILSLLLSPIQGSASKKEGEMEIGSTANIVFSSEYHNSFIVLIRKFWLQVTESQIRPT